MKIIRVGQNVLIMMVLLGILEFYLVSGRLGWQLPNPTTSNIAHGQADALVPSPRYGASMAFDERRKRVVLFGGCTGDCRGGANKSNETWEFDGITWTKITPTHSPPGRFLAGMVYDSQREVIVLFGGYQQNDTWEYDGSDWTSIATPNRPPVRIAVDLTYDSTRQVTILSSGYSPPYCSGGTSYTDVWEYNGSNWIKNINAVGPFNELPSIAYDPIGQKTIHFVGRYNCNLYNQTWAYNGITISQLSPSISPPPTSGPIQFDKVLDKVALFGGCTGSNSLRCTQYSNDIWAFDGIGWNLLNITNKPPGRYFHSITYDTTRQRLVAFGGCANYYWGFNCTEALNDLWEFDGEQWKKFNPQAPILNCSEPQYYGIQHCRKGKTEVLIVDPTDPHVRFETVLAQGYNKDSLPDEDPTECRDVNTPARVSTHQFPGPRCHIKNNNAVYPAESVGQMAIRDPNNIAVAAFNTDYFDNAGYRWGPQGLTVKNGSRLDGPCYGDNDGGDNNGGGYNGRNNSHLAISKTGTIAIGIAGSEAPDDCKLENGKEVPFVTNPDKYWNAVGGGPLLVERGVSVVKRECETPNRYCPSRYNLRARTAVGKTVDGKLIIAVLPESPGAVLDGSLNSEEEDLAELMISLGAFDAINFDGGGSSQLWYNGNYLVSHSRPVPGGLLVFSVPKTTYSISGRVTDSNNNPIGDATISAGSTMTATDNSGNYTLDGLVVGYHTITPLKSGFSFTPSSLYISVPPDSAGQDFIGTPNVCPVEAALAPARFNANHELLRTGDLIALYRQFRDEVLYTTELGQGYSEVFDQYGLELSLILLTDSDLRSRTAQFLDHASPAFASLLPSSTEEVVLTEGLYREAEGLVHDLANAGSSTFHDKIVNTWGDLALEEHIGETAEEIWVQIHQHSIFIPLIKSN